MVDFTSIVQTLQSRKDLLEEEMAQAVQLILSGAIAESSLHDFLVALHEKGETAEELAGAAAAMRSAMIPIPSAKRPVFDTCGTGGDGSKTFNISTAAAIVLAGTGCLVAKHGNRKITSSTGSADVLVELGINLGLAPELVTACLSQVGMCFCFAPQFHPAMRHVGPVRRQLAHPTIFNRLGPLTNPALAEHQVIGVGDRQLQDKLAAALQRLGTKRSIVVRGDDGVDEISLSAATRVLEVTPQQITEHWWTPDMFGVRQADRSLLFADDPASSANCINQVLDGRSGACRDVVVINVAAALWLQSSATDLSQCAQQAQASIDQGRARDTLTRLAQFTQPLNNLDHQ